MPLDLRYGGRDLTAQYLALLGKDGKNII